jgi:hypothetical protein
MKKSLIFLFILIVLLTLTTSSVYAFPERMPLPPQIVFCAIHKLDAFKFFNCDNLNSIHASEFNLRDGDLINNRM